MNRNHISIKLGLLAAGIATASLVTAGNARIAPQAAEAKRNQAVAVVQSSRTPVISLTKTMGDVGFEIFDGQTKRYNLWTLPKDATDAIVYIDVDSIEWNRKRVQAVLDLARDMNWVVMAESGTWDVPRLHAFLATHYPGMNTKGLQNVAVRIGWDKDRAVATDLTPSAAAVEVGIDYLQTSEAKAMSGSAFSTKSAAAGSKWAWFAKNAYQAKASDRNEHGRLYTVVLDRDVVKVWRSTTNGMKNCVVAWRGSYVVGDWERNFESQFGKLVRMEGEADNPWAAKIGHGFSSRLKNNKDYVDAVDCGNKYVVTGHSLGGAMAEVYAFTVRTTRPILEAYNPARVGNSYFRAKLRSDLNDDDLRVFCRHGDPVWGLPIGLEHVGTNNGCTLWAPKVSNWPLTNHKMDLWL
jgi:hypothetical protein